jgi:uncharacterized protein YoxC
MLQILIISVILLALVFLSIGIKLVVNKKNKINIRSCSSTVTGESCACGGECDAD